MFDFAGCVDRAVLLGDKNKVNPINTHISDIKPFVRWGRSSDLSYLLEKPPSGN